MVPIHPTVKRAFDLVQASTMTAQDVAEILSKQPNNRDKTIEYLQDRWVASKVFHLMEAPLASLGTATQVEPGHTSRTTGPIIVDENIQQVGRLRDPEGRTYGATPIALVLDGKHRVAGALARGDKTIQTYAGDRIVPYLKRELQAHGEKEREIHDLIDEFLVSDQPGGILSRLKSLLPPDELLALRNKWRTARGLPLKVS